jgi:Asp-tRNA(Asn)/Glu-tRNA(Gln) amidotransferase A subunit family amidase
MRGPRRQPLPPPELISFQDATAAFASGEDTPRAFLDRALARLDAWEPQLQAFAALGLGAARDAADASTERWRAGEPLSSIDGMPVGIKDVLDTADLPTEVGLKAYIGRRPLIDAAAVLGLRRAGAVVVGKTATTEFAMTHPAPTRNPFDLDRTPGGSSSGSAAAVGAGVLPAALGTQAIGSVLRPASYCGAFGYKPTSGAINRGGSHDTQSQSTIGVIGAGLADLWRTAWEIGSRVGGDPGAVGLLGEATPRVATQPATVVHLETDGWSSVGAAVGRQFGELADRLERSGVRVLHRTNDASVARLEDELRDALSRGRAMINVESRWPLQAVEARFPGTLSDTLAERMRAAAEVDTDGYRALLDWRAQARDDFAALMERADAVVTLTAPTAAPTGLNATGDAALTVVSSVLGVPALSLPVFEDAGLPVGLQLVGARDRDAALFGTAAWVLEETGHAAGS